MKVIYLGAGGFWLMEAVYQQVKGVVEVIPGYMGGTVANPSEEMVATGTTGHAEVVKITYDDSMVSTEVLLKLFFALHDPAIPNHATTGIGSQYRAVIFYTEAGEGEALDKHNGDEVGVIARVVQEVQTTMPEGVTVSSYGMSATEFYPANELHYNYYQNHSADDYCITVIQPPLEKVKKQFPEYF